MLTRILTRLLVVVFGLVILFVSVARASLNLMAQDGSLENIKNEEVKFLVTFGDGETASGTYKLPQSGMLPSSILYGFKRVRDYLWLTFSKGTDKIKLAILLADKKVAEFNKLTENGQRDKAVESGNDAIDKLEYANTLASALKVGDGESKQIRKQLLWAGLAYEEIFARSEREFEIDSEKYTKLKNRINDWNKEQEKNRFNWSY